jgi:hypothetical protein
LDGNHRLVSVRKLSIVGSFGVFFPERPKTSDAHW